MADELRESFGAEASLIVGGGGIFDVVVDGDLVFSKSEAGRFPDPGEIVTKLQQ